METRDSLVRKELAQAQNLEVGAAIAREQLTLVKLDVEMRKDNMAVEQAKDFHHQFFLFADAIDLRNVTNCIEVLGVWNRKDPTCDMEIAFHSSGGSALAGMALFDFISRLKVNHRVTTSVLGYSASMAGILLQAGTRRVIGRETFVLLHDLTAQAVGKIADIEDTTAFLRKIQSRVADIFVERSGGRIDRDTFLEKSKREWWLDSTELMKWGFADEVI